MLSFNSKELQELIYSTLKKVLKEERELTQSNSQAPQYLTRKDVAEIFSVSLVTIDAWANKSILKKHYIGGQTRFKKEEVELALKSFEG